MFKVVDSHHKVLFFWAEYRKTLKNPPRLISLDHHTDTSPPFRTFIKKNHSKILQPDESDFLKIQSKCLNAVDYKDLESVKGAIDKLNNDEHIITAIKTDILSSAFVLAHNAANTDLEVYKEHKIVCRSVDEIFKSGFLKPDHDTVLESSLLDKSLMGFNAILKESEENLLFEEPFILDIDLDYFNTFKSVKPDDAKTFKSLIKKAGLVTIATEPEYVKLCAVDKGITSEYLLKRILEII